MRKFILGLIVSVLPLFAASAYELVGPSFRVLLYPEGQDSDKGIVENGKALTLGPGESNGLVGDNVVNPDNGNISNIGDGAYMDIYLPENCNGHPSVPLTDVQNAFRYCRAHAGEWGISQIGVMGFSAGGHLAASASTLFVDELTRPDFSVLVYPVISFDEFVTHAGTRLNLVGPRAGKDMVEYYSLDRRVGPDTPPTLLLLSADKLGTQREDFFRILERWLESRR